MRWKGEVAEVLVVRRARLDVDWKAEERSRVNGKITAQRLAVWRQFWQRGGIPVSLTAKSQSQFDFETKGQHKHHRSLITRVMERSHRPVV